jgi:hypothetical protein
MWGIRYVVGYHGEQFERETYENISDAKVFMNRESERDKVVVRYFKILVRMFNGTYDARKVIIKSNVKLINWFYSYFI